MPRETGLGFEAGGGKAWVGGDPGGKVVLWEHGEVVLWEHGEVAPGSGGIADFGGGGGEVCFGGEELISG